MTEVEKLRALLAEAHSRLPVGDMKQRIDAALAEPVKADPTLTVREACRRRMPLDGTDAQALEHAITITERERDEARAEVERLHDLLGETRLERTAARVDVAAAYKRGAEAMREAAAQDCIELWGKGHLTGTLQAERIRALPIPEDKP